MVRWAFAIVAFAGTASAQVAPGTLIGSEPMAGAPAGVDAQRIRYASTDRQGRALTLTAVVMRPIDTRPRTALPVIAWTHGAWGIAPACTPSLSPNFFRATAAVAAVARGYVVVAPDYPGLGSPGPHPFLVGESVARATLDAVRAARASGGDRRFAVWGESQGGHAALFTGETARRYAPDLTLMGVAAAAPPTDLVSNLTAGGDPSIRAFMTAYVAQSWSQVYDADLRTLGNARTQKLIGTLAEKCVTLDARPNLGTMLRVAVLRRDLRNVNLGQIQPWARLARQNSVGQHPPGAAVLIAQAVNDPLVSAPVTRAFAKRLCARGSRVRYIALPGGSHATSAADSATVTLDWIDARFAGKPARTDCRTI